MSHLNKAVVPRNQRANLKFGVNAMIVLGLFGIYCFVNVWQNVSISYLNRQNENLRSELKALERECDILMLEIEALKDPERIRRVLSEKIKIVPAEKINIKVD
ncbi:hypothetical protein EH223_07370 [candidate division KSB1 bacterium]|nr:hypothetical protein [candidate division KSB1 bacterium]RQW04366.1 MAG: hypothetical protein EH223_07370 [candidate division KSB1 bacterium]